MLFASASITPEDSVFTMRSEPAKSTSVNLDVVYVTATKLN